MFFVSNVLGMSLLLSIFVMTANDLGSLVPAMIYTSLGITGAIVHAFTQTINPYLYNGEQWAPAFSGAKLALIGCGSLSLWNTQELVEGVQLLTMDWTCFAGIPLTTIYVATKVNKVIQLYGRKKPDHLEVASFQFITKD